MDTGNTGRCVGPLPSPFLWTRKPRCVSRASVSESCPVEMWMDVEAGSTRGAGVCVVIPPLYC